MIKSLPISLTGLVMKEKVLLRKYHLLVVSMDLKLKIPRNTQALHEFDCAKKLNRDLRQR